MSDLLQYLQRKVGQALDETWSHTPPISIQLSQIETGCDGSITVGASYLVRRRDGIYAVVHDEPAVTLVNEQVVDDFLARGLSSLLMKHPVWPD